MASGTEDTSNTDITSITEKMKYNFIDAIDVAVGETKTWFRIPKNLICKHSTFFAAACSDRWATDDESEPIDLSDEKAEVFEIYLQWLYTGELVIDEVNGSTETIAAVTSAAMATAATTTAATINTDECQERRWMKLVELYVLADKLGDSKATEMLKEDVDNRIVDACNGTQEPPPAAVFRFVWNHTVESSELREVLLSYAVGRMQDEQIHELGDHVEGFYSDCVELFLACLRYGDAEAKADLQHLMDGHRKVYTRSGR